MKLVKPVKDHMYLKIQVKTWKLLKLELHVFFFLSISSMFWGQGVWYLEIPLKYKLRPGCSLLDSF